VIGGLVRVLIVTLVLLVTLATACKPGVTPTPGVATVLDAPRPLPAVAMVDQDGRPFAIGNLAGKPTLVFFGFTHCPDICPLTLAVLAQAMATLRSEDSPPQVLFVSIDPGRDTPALIKAYVSAFDDDFLGATADEASIAPLIATLGLTVHKEQQGDEVYNVVHNGTVYVLDASGHWAAIFGGSSHRAEAIVADYRILRGQLAGE
jgi:protein SCO1/2